VVICLERGADCLHMLQLMPLHLPNPDISLPHLNPDWFYFSGTGLPSLSWKSVVLNQSGSYHVKYMFVGDGVKAEVEKVIRSLRPALQLRLRFISHHGREDATPTSSAT